MKKLFKILGFGLLSIVIFFVAIAAISMIGSVDKEEVLIPYIESAIPRLTTWDISEYKTLMSEDGFNGITPEQWDLYLKLFTKLGTLESVGTPELQNWRTMSGIPNGKTTYADYLIPLAFDTGPAHVELGLKHNKNKTEINSVRFLSDLLIQ